MTHNVFVLLADGSRVPLHQFASRFGNQLISMARHAGGRVQYFGGRMSAQESRLYPVTAWRFAIGASGGAEEVTLLEVAYAKDVGEMRAAAAGARPNNTLPLGLTAKQCRDLAADLVEAANKADGGSGPKH